MTAPVHDKASSETAETHDGGTIGAQLRRARDAQNKSTADIASALRLDTGKIAALETDSAPDDAFTRGYIRAYARLVDIDPETLLGETASHNLAQEPSDSPESGGLRSYRPIRQAGSNDRLMRLASWLIGAALIGLLVVWGFSNRDRILSVLPTGDDEPGVLADLPPPRLDYVYPIIEHPQQLPPAEITEALIAQSSPDSFSATDAEADPQMAGTDVGNLATTAAVELQVAGESWIEVYDANGKRIFFGLAKAGRSIPISGPRPLNFKIGNSAQVTLLIDDEPQSFAAFSTEGVARFHLTVSGLQAPPEQ